MRVRILGLQTVTYGMNEIFHLRPDILCSRAKNFLPCYSYPPVRNLESLHLQDSGNYLNQISMIG